MELFTDSGQINFELYGQAIFHNNNIPLVAIGYGHFEENTLTFVQKRR